MATITQHSLKEIREKLNLLPSVSVIMPFEPSIQSKSSITKNLNEAIEKASQFTEGHYDKQLGELVISKLKSIVSELNYNSNKKSIAIYVSPVFQKVLYLNIAVEEHVVVDDFFEIRDLVYCKKQSHKYLALLLSEKQAKIFMGTTDSFLTILTNNFDSVFNYINDAAEPVANFSDPDKRNEIIMDKFLHHIDNSLTHILNAYHLPLFILGTKKITGHFKKISKHNSAVIDCIHGNYEEANPKELLEVLKPHIDDWKKVSAKDLLNQLAEAANNKKLVAGMHNVWKAAHEMKGKLLLVEKDFMFPAEHENSNRKEPAGNYNRYTYIKDAVDELIERVFESGGDIEFVEKGLLQSYDRIALITHY